MARYDRTAALIDGEVNEPGLDLEITELNEDPARQTLGLSGRFDAWEAYAGRYLIDREAGRDEFVAVPVFPKRTFRHGSIYVRRDQPLAPHDLVGRRVGIQHWSTTAAIWARALLADEHGLDLRAIDWVQTSPDPPAWRRPPWLRIEQAPAATDLPTLLRTGEIQAAISSEAWVPFEHADVAFLFPDHAQRERDSFLRTRIFPIMHLLVVRSSILGADAGIGPRLVAAWSAAKDRCLRRLERDRLLVTSMWFGGLVEEEYQAAGARDTYPYGLRRSRHEFEALVQHAADQGVIERRRPVDDYFHPSTLDT